MEVADEVGAPVTGADNCDIQGLHSGDSMRGGIYFRDSATDRKV
jgi:hypothetical protein